MAIRLLALDVDGVLTDGTLYYTAAGEEMKAFNAQDGLGLKLLMRLGVEIAVISGRGSAVLERRLDDLGITERRLKCTDKGTALEDICADLDIPVHETAFMGDDLIDLSALQICGCPIAPANAVEEVKAFCRIVTAASGGQGAVREACEILARKQGTSLIELFTGAAGGISQ